VFIFTGLILTTMCIDLVGGDMINRIHYFGTHVQMAREALAAWGGRAGNLNEWLRARRNRGALDDKEYLALLLGNHHVEPFNPALSNIKFIDQLASTITPRDDRSSQADTLPPHVDCLAYL